MIALTVHVLLSAISVSSAMQLGVVQTASAEFKEYIASFGRDYQEGTPEYSERQALFHRRLKFISVQNSRPDRLWTAAVNSLTDRTDKELAMMKGWRHVHEVATTGVALLEESVHIAKKPAAKVDWRKLSMAQPVPDQGGCGSCWAVAATTMMQGRYEVQLNKSRSFSAQQLVNCVANPNECGGTGGCQGATVELAMDYVSRMGLHDELVQPYLGQDMNCQDDSYGALGSFLSLATRTNHDSSVSTGLKHWHKLPENKALPLMLAVMEGPVAISVAASDWGYYGSGVFDGCSKDAVIDHAVVLFGYGADNGAKYWTIRNSWGPSWGEDGFIRLLRQATPQADEEFCGTDNDPAAGIACKPYPKSVTVCGMCGMLYDSVVATFK